MGYLTFHRGGACDHVICERPSEWMELCETRSAEGERAITARLETSAGRVTVTDITGCVLLFLPFLVETEDDVGQSSVLGQSIDATFT